MKPVAVALLFLVAQQGFALACEPAMVDWPSDATRANLVVEGYVTGERYPDYEAEVLEGLDPEIVPMPGTRLVRVVPTKAHKGSWRKPVEVSVSCGAPHPKVYEKVLVIRSGQGAPWLLVPSFEEERVLTVLRAEF